MTQFDTKYFERRFYSLPPGGMASVVLRAAMRVLPILAYNTEDCDVSFAYWKEQARSRHILSIFRSYQTSAVVCQFATTNSAISDEIANAAANATAAANAAANSADNARVTDAAYAYIAANATAAAYAANVAYAATDVLAAPSTSTVRAIYAARAAKAIAKASKAIESDMNMLGKASAAADLLIAPLWPEEEPAEISTLWQRLHANLLGLQSEFEVWIEWYSDRMAGKPLDRAVEYQWSNLSKERLAQSPSEINAYLKELRDCSLTKQLKRVRAIFIGHGDAGKTSLIKALHGEDVIAGAEDMTKGIVIKDCSIPSNKIDEEAGVFTSVTEYKEDDLTVHFWDFGGQVMAHATHQFFLRAKCLYVIVLAARAERNPNEEAEYWLEHVRAFGENAPVLIVGNKSDVMPVNLDLRTLKEKYPNIVDFYPMSCTQAKTTFKARFDLFREEFAAKLKAFGEQAERFTPSQFSVLRSVQEKAAKDDFLSESSFDAICIANGIAMEGAGGRDGLLDIFDKLGIVMHFSRLPYLTDCVLNPRWLTYGVYTIMYSEQAQLAKGRISEAELVAILKNAQLPQSDGRAICYPADRCHMIADAMIAFQVAYRLGNDRLVIPALLAAEQPNHDFKTDGGLAFQFDFKGFLPRHVLPALIVGYHQDIERNGGGQEVVWQNGVLLRPKRHDARALVRADHHTRNIDIFVRGTDANEYLVLIRDSILRTLDSMPELPFDEKVELRSEMRVHAEGPSQDAPVWMSYGSVRGAQKRGRVSIDGPDGHEYSMARILSTMPRPDLALADIFLSYSHKDGGAIKGLADALDRRHYSAWFDKGLIAGQPYRDVLKERIDTTKAVVVLWSENSIGSQWVRAEAALASQHKKLICLRVPKLGHDRIPMPFGANEYVIDVGDLPELLKALALKGVKPRL